MANALQVPAEQAWFARQVARSTGLDPGVVLTWVRAEKGSGGGSDHNYLNVRTDNVTKGYSGVAIAGATSAGFAKFGSVQDAAKETAYWINRMPHFSGIKSAAGKPAGVQLAAIARSPWDTNHYKGGKQLTDVYKSLGGKAIATAIGAGKTKLPLGATGDPLGGFPGGSAVSSAAGAVQHGAETAAHILVQGLIDVALVSFAALLLYEGIRRMSGDRLPNPREAAGIGSFAPIKAGA